MQSLATAGDNWLSIRWDHGLKIDEEKVIKIKTQEEYDYYNLSLTWIKMAQDESEI